MMLRQTKNKKRAIAMIDYLGVLAAVILAIVAMKTYAQNAVQGRWKAVGDAVSFGAAYDSGEVCQEHSEFGRYNIDDFKNLAGPGCSGEKCCDTYCFSNAGYDAEKCETCIKQAPCSF